MTTATTETVGGLLRAWRELRGLTLAEAAERADVAQRTLRRTEVGGAEPTIGLVAAMVDALEIDAAGVGRIMDAARRGRK